MRFARETPGLERREEMVDGGEQHGIGLHRVDAVAQHADDVGLDMRELHALQQHARSAPGDVGARQTHRDVAVGDRRRPPDAHGNVLVEDVRHPEHVAPQLEVVGGELQLCGGAVQPDFGAHARGDADEREAAAGGGGFPKEEDLQEGE